MELLSKYWRTKRVIVVVTAVVFIVAVIFLGIAGIRKSNEDKSLVYFRNEYNKCIKEKNLVELCDIYQKMIKDTPIETQKFFNIGLYILLIYFSGLLIYSSVH